MNLSGAAVQAVVESGLCSAVPERMIVVHDDLDLALGRIKLKKSGGDGGHNGLKSIIESLGRADFVRLRLGIGSALRRRDTIDYVLSDFSEEELPLLSEVLKQGVHALRLMLTDGVEQAMNQVNRRAAG